MVHCEHVAVAHKAFTCTCKLVGMLYKIAHSLLTSSAVRHSHRIPVYYSHHLSEFNGGSPARSSAWSMESLDMQIATKVMCCI